MLCCSVLQASLPPHHSTADGLTQLHDRGRLGAESEESALRWCSVGGRVHGAGIGSIVQRISHCTYFNSSTGWCGLVALPPSYSWSAPPSSGHPFRRAQWQQLWQRFSLRGQRRWRAAPRPGCHAAPSRRPAAPSSALQGDQPLCKLQRKALMWSWLARASPACTPPPSCTKRVSESGREPIRCLASALCSCSLTYCRYRELVDRGFACLLLQPACRRAGAAAGGVGRRRRAGAPALHCGVT